MTRFILVSMLGAILVTVAVLGWRGRPFTRPPLQPFDDMVVTPRYNAQEASRFFADGRAQRLPPAHTVPWGSNARQPDATFRASDAQRYTLASNPVAVDRRLLTRGQLLFERYCVVCHGATGAGNGITTQYNMNPPSTYHSPRLREVTDGYLYQVITEGKNTMGPYGGRIDPADRWAVVAYVRVLQRAFNAALDDVPPARRAELQQERSRP